MTNDTPNFSTATITESNAYFWQDDFLWLSVISDAGIGLAYLCFPICLFLVIRNRPPTPSRPLLILLSVAVFALGTTHLFAVWAAFQVSTNIHIMIKALAAVIAVAAAVKFFLISSKLATLKTPVELELANVELKIEMALQKKLTNKLRRTEKQFRTFLRQAPDGIFICNLNGRIEYSNIMLQKMFGYPNEDLVGENLIKLLPYRSREKISTEHNHLFDESAARSRLRGAEFTAMRRDETEFPAEIKMSPITSGDEELLLVTLRDISDRKEHEEASRKNLVALADESRMSAVGQMATGLAHELNQPLTSMSTNLHTAMLIYSQSENPDPELSEIMAENYAVAQHAGQIIRSLRQMVRKDELDRTEIEINELVRTTAALIEPEARSVGVDIQLNLDKCQFNASVNPVQIQQVIVNLGRNAIESFSDGTHSNAMISITTEPYNSNFMLITVEDNGTGVKKELVASLFQPHITSKETGMGLGLSISQSIIELVNGKLWYQGHNGVGAIFCFTIPTLQRVQH